MKKSLLQLSVFLILSSPSLAQIVDIPDPIFKDVLINVFVADFDGDGVYDGDVDANNDGEIQVTEAEAVLGLKANDMGINSIEGINAFINLRRLEVTNNNIESIALINLTELLVFWAGYNVLTELTFENLPNLGTMALFFNELTTLDVSMLYSLYFLNVNGNNLLDINVAGLSNLEQLLVRGNQLTDIDLTGLSALYSLWISVNPLTELNLDTVPLMWNLEVRNTDLTSIDLSALPELYAYEGGSNNIDVLDFSQNPELFHLELVNTLAKQINFKNGSALSTFEFSGGANLEYVCVDDFEAPQILTKLEIAGVTGVTVNSYCSFDPGGDVFMVNGDARFDVTIDGCDASDAMVPFMRYDISDGSESGTYYADASGNYSISVNEGDYNFSPSLDHLLYFTATPETLDLSFPDDGAVFEQNYCLTATGIFNDLEVTIYPITQARPGFEAEYGILVSNVGTTNLSGELELTFEEPVLNFVSADVPPNTISDGLLLWNFVDLHPFNSQNFELTFLLNTPTDSPPLNAGDILDFMATLSFTGVDETPDNNETILKQTVVNSYDPNDKRALEGDKILKESVGEFMHYLIRFENLGTANAINVVVADTINTSNYQLSSFVPLHGSHDFETRVNDNVVEFIFEDINLPFDDANNDGFVLFKIKTQETLMLGDSFSNKAGIYFDFNAPIMTNNAITTVVNTLGTDTFDSELSLRLFPNPTSDVINIVGLESAQHKSLGVYNLQGRLLMDNSGDSESIDVSGLSSGLYLIKIETAKGTVFMRFLKD